MTVEVARLAPDLIRIGCFPAGRPLDYASAALAREFEPVATLGAFDGLRVESGETEPGALFGPSLRAVLPRREGEAPAAEGDAAEGGDSGGN